MSKSAGNFFTINDLVARGFRGPEIRYTLIASHYRQPMNFTIEGLEGDARAVARLRGLAERLAALAAADGGKGAPDADLARRLAAARVAFDAAIDDDLNVSGGLGVLHETARVLGREGLAAADAAAGLRFLEHADEILGVIFTPVAAAEELAPEERELLDRRAAARAARDFPLADQLRARLLERGVLVKDGPKGQTWERKR
jgi:cysteinyl-tRNA synthetase